MICCQGQNNISNFFFGRLTNFEQVWVKLTRKVFMWSYKFIQYNLSLTYDRESSRISSSFLRKKAELQFILEPNFGFNWTFMFRTKFPKSSRLDQLFFRPEKIRNFTFSLNNMIVYMIVLRCKIYVLLRWMQEKQWHFDANVKNRSAFFTLSNNVNGNGLTENNAQRCRNHSRSV